MKYSWILILLSVCLLPASEDMGTLWKASAPNSKWMAATRRVADAERIWKEEMDGTKLVLFPLSPAPDSIAGSLYFSCEIAGRIIEKIGWTPDSNYLVFTTSSSGGHSPWHFTSYMVQLSAKKMIRLDDFIGSVVAPEFEIKAPHSVVFKIARSNKDGIDFERPLSKTFDLGALPPKSSAK